MGASASLLEKVSPELQAEINAEVEKLKADGVSEDDIATQMKEKYAAQLATADSIACINIAYSCPDDKAEEVKAVFMEHAAWMEEFYKGDEGKAYLIRMHFSTGKQLNDPMNPEGGATGNTLFYINEQFVNKEAVGRHVENAQKNAYFEKFGGIMKDYGVAVGLGTDIYASIRNADDLAGYPDGVACINIAYCCPDDKAEEVKGVFTEHATWMDEFYKGDEGKAYLLKMHFSTAKQLNDPMNPEGGATGNTLFYINELFTNKEAVGRHVENAQKNAYFEKFGGIMKDYGVAVGLGTDIYASIRN